MNETLPFTCRRPDSVILVSDGMVALGLPAGTYTFGEVGEVDVVGGDKVYRSGTKTLAGAAVALDECTRRFKRFCGCSMVRALEAASLHPAQALGIESSKGSLVVGADADLVLLDDSLTVHATYIAGARVWPPPEADNGVAAGGLVGNVQRW